MRRKKISKKFSFFVDIINDQLLIPCQKIGKNESETSNFGMPKYF